MTLSGIGIHIEQFILRLIDYKDVPLFNRLHVRFPLIFMPKISNVHFTPVLITFDTNLTNTVLDSCASAGLAFLHPLNRQFWENSWIQYHRPLSRKYNTFVFWQVRYLPLKINILKKNDHSPRRNDSPTGNINNFIGCSKDSRGIIFGVGDCYFLWEFD